jgi:hypothetical protein
MWYNKLLVENKGESMKRKVVKVENYIHPNATGTKGSNMLTLECGHVKRQKGSVPVPKYCLCKECDNTRPKRTQENLERTLRKNWDSAGKRILNS